MSHVEQMVHQHLEASPRQTIAVGTAEMAAVNNHVGNLPQW